MPQLHYKYAISHPISQLYPKNIVTNYLATVIEEANGAIQLLYYFVYYLFTKSFLASSQQQEHEIFLLLAIRLTVFVVV